MLLKLLRIFYAITLAGLGNDVSPKQAGRWQKLRTEQGDQIAHLRSGFYHVV